MNKVNYINDFSTWKKGFEFYTPIYIRFSETDMFGHMNNISPLIYFEEARIKFYQSLNIYSDIDNPTEFPIVADIQCDYHKQVYFDQDIKIYVKIASIGNSSFDMHYLAVDETDDVCFTGRGRIVNIDAKTGRPVQLQKQVRQVLKETIV